MRTVASACMIVLMSACGGDRPTPSTPTGPAPITPAPAAPPTLRVSVKSPSTNVVVPGRTVSLTAVLVDPDGRTRDVTESAVWQSSNPSAATVAAGVVSAAAEAVVDIKATYQNVSEQTQIHVRRTCEAATASITPETARLKAMEYQTSVVVKVASSDCRWVAIPEGSFPRQVDNDDESGDGAFSYYVGTNNLATPRSGKIRVIFPDGSTLFHTFIQDEPLCSYVPVPASVVLPAPGGSGSFKLVTTPETCRWRLEQYEGRLGEGMSITSPRQGIGSTTVSYRIAHPKDRPSSSYPVYILPGDRTSSPDALHSIQIVVPGR